jgi:hypothetical protein
MVVLDYSDSIIKRLYTVFDIILNIITYVSCYACERLNDVWKCAGARADWRRSSLGNDSKFAGSNIVFGSDHYYVPHNNNWFAVVSIMWPAATNMLRCVGVKQKFTFAILPLLLRRCLIPFHSWGALKSGTCPFVVNMLSQPNPS